MSVLNYELFFGLGILLQLIFSIGTNFKKSDIWNVLISLFIGFYGTAKLADNSTPPWTTEELLFSVIVITSCTLAIFFKDRLLNEINELVLLGWNIIFWFVYVTHFGFWNYLTLVLLVPTYLSAVIIFFDVKLNTFFKTILYVWFLLILSYIGIVYFKFQNILFYKDMNITDNPLSMVFAGMVFFYIIVNIVNVLSLVPIPLQKRQSFSNRMQEVREHIKFLASRYSDYQSRWFVSLVTSVLFSSVLISNFYFGWVDEPTLISLCTAIIPTLAKKYDSYLSFISQPVQVPLINQDPNVRS